MSNFDFSAIDAHVHTYRSREVGRQAMMGIDRTDYGGTPDELLALMSRGGIEKAAAVLRQVGCDRVMFGSDYPWFDPVLDAARIQRLPLTDAEKRAVLHENAILVLRL